MHNNEYYVYVAAKTRPIIPYPNTMITISIFSELLKNKVHFYKYTVRDLYYNIDNFKSDVTKYVNEQFNSLGLNIYIYIL